MPIKFAPIYTIDLNLVSCLLRIESAKEKVNYLPMTPAVLASLREAVDLGISENTLRDVSFSIKNPLPITIGGR
jgi:hypothetical protein